jgi:hypothetical protein
MVVMELQQGEEMTLREWIDEWRAKGKKDPFGVSSWAEDLIARMEADGLMDSVITTNRKQVGELILPAEPCKVLGND